MNYNLNIREEVFGATLNNIDLGRREYITKEELKDILENNKFYDGIASNIENPKIKFTKLHSTDINHFSFADIAFIELTRACNLRCTHCLNNSGTKMDNQLSKEEILKLIKDLADCGLQEVRLTGGEPLLFQGIYGIFSIVGPTSLILIFTLSYMNVPYTTWLKYIWRFILALIVLLALVTLLIVLL